MTSAFQMADDLISGAVLDNPRVAAWRDRAGRAGTVLGAGCLIASAFTSQALALGGPWIIGASAVGLAAAWRRWGRGTHEAVLALYAAPAGSLIAGMGIFQLSHGLRWWEGVCVAAWSAAVWRVRPARTAQTLARTLSDTDEHGHEHSQTLSDVVRTYVRVRTDGHEHSQTHGHSDTPEGKLCGYWDTYVSGDSGAAPGTHLEQVQVHGPRDFSAHIVAVPGTPVPSISVAALSALMDIPEDKIHITGVPGRGAGRKQLIVGTQPEVSPAANPHMWWATTVAPKAMPNSRIVGIRRGSVSLSKDAGDSP